MAKWILVAAGVCLIIVGLISEAPTTEREINLSERVLVIGTGVAGLTYGLFLFFR
jgi:heterodisulfide reductase subunit A-like polyferredoxin